MSKTSSFDLQLLDSLKKEAERIAGEDGATLNQFINLAVAEKISAMRTVEYFRERAARADMSALDWFLDTAGDEPPQPGDELPPGYVPVRRKSS